MNPVKIGLVGIGGFGASHLGCLQRLLPERLFKLVAVADPALENYTQTTAPLREQGVACYMDYLEMLDKGPDLEAVILCTPVPLHKEMAAEALHRGLHVYLEKPPVILSSDLHQLINLAPHGRTCVGFVGVSQPTIRRFHSKIVQGAIGELRGIRIAASWPRPSWYYERSGWAGKLVVGLEPVFDGPATNALSHYVHLASRLACADPNRHENLGWLEAELYRARPIEAYDTCSLKGQFFNGIDFTIALTHASRHKTDVEVRLIGTKGNACLSIGNSSVRSDLFHGLEDTTRPLDTNLKNFYDGIRGTSRFHTTLEDCIPFLQMIAGMWISSNGVHSIDPAHVSTWRNKADTVFDVSDLQEGLARSLDGMTFSSQGFPWAIKPTRKSAEECASANLKTALLAAKEKSLQTTMV